MVGAILAIGLDNQVLVDDVTSTFYNVVSASPIALSLALKNTLDGVEVNETRLEHEMMYFVPRYLSGGTTVITFPHLSPIIEAYAEKYGLLTYGADDSDISQEWSDTFTKYSHGYYLIKNRTIDSEPVALEQEIQEEFEMALHYAMKVSQVTPFFIRRPNCDFLTLEIKQPDRYTFKLREAIALYNHGEYLDSEKPRITNYNVRNRFLDLIHVKVYLKIPLIQTWINSQTHIVPLISGILRNTLSFDSKAVYKIRVAALLDHLPEAKTDPSWSIHGTNKGVPIDVSGHMQNMVVAAYFGQANISRYFTTIHGNALVSKGVFFKHLSKAEKYKYVSAELAADNHYWHSYDDWYVGAIAGFKILKMLGANPNTFDALSREVEEQFIYLIKQHPQLRYVKSIKSKRWLENKEI
jgi:hypothetical protein